MKLSRKERRLIELVRREEKRIAKIRKEEEGRGNKVVVGFQLAIVVSNHIGIISQTLREVLKDAADT